MAAASTGAAGQPMRVSTTRPQIDLAPAVRVVAFRRPAGQAGAYTGGSLPVAIDVENTGATAAENVMVKVASGAKSFEGALTIPARTTRTIVLVDAEGLASSCEAKPYAISLVGAGIAENKRSARITPSCSFSSTLEETWNLMKPDQVEAERNGNAYVTSPSIAAAPACGKAAPSIKARVVNKSAKSSPSLIVQAKDATAGSVKAQTSAAFPLASGEQKEVLLTPVANAGAEPAVKMKLSLVDWTKSLGGRTSDGGIFVNTTRSCALDFAME